jgi:hypothetical protein
MDIWRVLPDSDRVHWVLDPFKSVGPLRFGMPAHEASSLVAEVIAYPPDEHKHWWPQRHRGYGRSSVKLYYRSGGLHGVSVEALRGPQVYADGRPLVAQVPSEIDEWIEQRAASRGKVEEIAYLGTADIVSRTLGAAFCIQRARDRLITRPVFLSDPGMEDVHHQLPSEAWEFF